MNRRKLEFAFQSLPCSFIYKLILDVTQKKEETAQMMMNSNPVFRPITHYGYFTQTSSGFRR